MTSTSAWLTALEVALGQDVEIFVGFGIIAGIVAAIGLGQRPLRIERAGLDAGEGGGIAGAGGGDRDLAFDLAVGDEAPQRQPQGAVIAAQPLGDVERAARPLEVDVDRRRRRR